MEKRKLSQDELLQLFKLDEEIIDVEQNENGLYYPVVRAYDDGEYHFHFWCIHCRTWHVHGRGGPKAEYREGRGGYAGHRSAHCTASNSPFKPNGVILHVVGKFTENLRKQYRKGTALYCPICRNNYSAAFNACGCNGRFINKKRKPGNPKMTALYQKIIESPTAL